MPTDPLHAAEVACTPEAGFSHCVRITYSGATQTFLVPAGATVLRVKAWGAGGGASVSGVGTPMSGAGGGFTIGTLDATPGVSLAVVVGAGGVAGGTGARFGGGAPGGGGLLASTGSSGGGYSGIFSNSTVSQATTWLIAGGGGGASTGADAGVAAGGGGGASGGQDGSPTASGRGGTQAAGGGAASQFGGCTAPQEGGAALAGGSGGGSLATGQGGGGGGGGWYGGGGGRCEVLLSSPNGAGGGGAGHVAPSAGAATTTAGADASRTAGATALPAGSSDFHYQAGVGVGGAAAAAGTVSGPGQVVIQWADTTLALAKSWVAAIANDTAELTAIGGINNASLSSVADTPDETDTGAAVLVQAGDVFTLAETFGSTNAGSYSASDWTCSAGSLSGNQLTIEAADVGQSIVCTITNSLRRADLSVTKTNTPASGATDLPGDTLASGSAVSYQIVVDNAGPDAADGAVLTDPAPTGMSCSAISCTPGGGATCPDPLDLPMLQAGVAIPALPANGSLTLTLDCTID